jgi:hypothetical protein
MDEGTKKFLIWTFFFFFWIAVSIFLYFSLNIKPLNIKPDITIEEAKCIGDNSLLYTQDGCRHCEKQLSYFGELKSLLNIIDCTETTICFKELIGSTPTWKINNETFEGVYSIKELKKMTGCE